MHEKYIFTWRSRFLPLTGSVSFVRVFFIYFAHALLFASWFSVSVPLSGFVPSRRSRRGSRPQRSRRASTWAPRCIGCWTPSCPRIGVWWGKTRCLTRFVRSMLCTVWLCVFLCVFLCDCLCVYHPPIKCLLYPFFSSFLFVFFVPRTKSPSPRRPPPPPRCLEAVWLASHASTASCHQEVPGSSPG